MKQLVPSVNKADHVSGNEFAMIELVEYGDYECPYCGRAYPVVKNIQRVLGRDLKFVFRNFPLRKIHPNAFSAALATEAASLQEKFWEMHDTIFENQRNLGSDRILRLARMIDINEDQLQSDMQLKVLTDKVEHDFESGLWSGVNRTPTFFINGEKFTGDWQNGQLLETVRRLANSIIIS